MLKPKMLEALDEQIKYELYSSYLYLSMGAWFHAKNLKGFANWMRVQAKEEDVHAMMFYDYIIGHGEAVTLLGIGQPPADFASATDVFEKTLEHERFVTQRIHNLLALAREEKDYATEIFLQWFVTEQIEEEDNADAALQTLRLIKESGSGLLLMDKDMAARVFVPPAAAGA